MSANKQSLHLTYATQMKNHPYGTALYTPLPFSQFHPGSVGYFTPTGLWNPITDLSLSHSLSLSPAPSELFTWGPKISASTKAIRYSLEADLDSAIATALPFDVGAWYKFHGEKEGGAVLLTSGEVRHERFYYESVFREWVQGNAESLVGERREVEEYGMWVVTSTWSVKEAALNCWKERGRNVGVGFKAGVAGVGEVAPSGEWVVGDKDGGWIKVESKERDDGRVVFFAGLRFRYRRLPFGEKLKPDNKPKFYSGGEEEAGVEMLTQIAVEKEGEPGEQEILELSCESFLETVSESGNPGGDGEEVEVEL